MVPALTGLRGRLTVDRWPDLASPPDTTTADRGHAPRYVDADRMWNRVEPLLPDLGITRVADVTGLDRLGLPVHVAMKPAGLSLSSGSGKGATHPAARLGAVMEAVEQTYWERPLPDLRRASERELQDEGAAYVRPDLLPLPRDQITSVDFPLSWVCAWDVLREVETWTPYEAIGLPGDDPERHLGRVLPSTNGLASGAHVLDALLAALNEVVERDAITLGAMRGTSIPTTLADDDATTLAAVLDRVMAARLTLDVYEETADDVRLPTFRAVIADPEDHRLGAFVGYGTSLSEEVAAVRAVTEAAQGRCVVIAGARDDIFEVHRRAGLRLAKARRPRSEVQPVVRTPRSASTGSILGDIDLTLSRLVQAGFDQIVVHRYTAADERVQVVRVVVPGLEGCRGPSYQPGPRARRLLAAG